MCGQCVATNVGARSTRVFDLSSCIYLAIVQRVYISPVYCTQIKHTRTKTLRETKTLMCMALTAESRLAFITELHHQECVVDLMRYLFPEQSHVADGWLRDLHSLARAIDIVSLDNPLPVERMRSHMAQHYEAFFQQHLKQSVVSTVKEWITYVNTLDTVTSHLDAGIRISYNRFGDALRNQFVRRNHRCDTVKCTNIEDIRYTRWVRLGAAVLGYRIDVSAVAAPVRWTDDSGDHCEENKTNETATE